MINTGKCPRCKDYALLRPETGWCFKCTNLAHREAKRTRQAEERSQRAAQSFRLRPPEPKQAERAPAALSSWDTEPLLRRAWEQSAEFCRASSTARHRLLTTARQAMRTPNPEGELRPVLQRLQCQDDPAREAAARALKTALEFARQDPEAMLDMLQALVAYADYREAFAGLREVANDLPAVTIRPDEEGRVSQNWLLRGARDFVQEIAANGLREAGPVREVLGYLRQIQARPLAPETRRRKLALLLPLEAAAAARAVKASRRVAGARRRLLELVRWAAETAAGQPEILIPVIIPAVEAVVAYHGLEEQCRHPRWAKEPTSQKPEGYHLRDGYLTADGTVRANLVARDAVAWASKFRGRDFTKGQIRRFFHELRRLETLSDSRPWPEVRDELVAMVPRAADAVARGLKIGEDYRALETLVRENVQALLQLPEERQAHAFRQGMMPHFEAILAHFNAQRDLRLDAPPAHPLAADEVTLRDGEARSVAQALRRGKISSTLLRSVYASYRQLKERSAEGLAAGVARLAALTDDALRRSGGTEEGKQTLRALVRAAEGLDPQQFAAKFLPHLESVVAWYYGLSALEEQP